MPLSLALWKVPPKRGSAGAGAAKTRGSTGLNGLKPKQSGGKVPTGSAKRLPRHPACPFAHGGSKLNGLMLGLVEKPMLLIVDDEKPTREGLRAALEDRYDVYLAEDAKTAMELLEREHFAVLLTDFRLPNEDGMKLITRAKSLSKPPICILM